MKNTKTAFNAAFYGIFALPAFLLIGAATSIFGQIKLFQVIYNWILYGGGFWILLIIETLIIMIALVLWYTLRLDNIESITTEEVTKRRRGRDPIVIEKVVIIKKDKGKSYQRKDIREIEKRDVEKQSSIVQRESIRPNKNRKLTALDEAEEPIVKKEVTKVTPKEEVKPVTPTTKTTPAPRDRGSWRP